MCAGKKHTPIVSEAQRRFFGLALHNPGKRPAGLSTVEIRRHLAESRGRELPAHTGLRRGTH